MLLYMVSPCNINWPFAKPFCRVVFLSTKMHKILVHSYLLSSINEKKISNLELHKYLCTSTWLKMLYYFLSEAEYLLPKELIEGLESYLVELHIHLRILSSFPHICNIVICERPTHKAGHPES